MLAPQPPSIQILALPGARPTRGLSRSCHGREASLPRHPPIVELPDQQSPRRSEAGRDYATGIVAVITGPEPTYRAVCPCPLVSSTNHASPGPTRRVVPPPR